MPKFSIIVPVYNVEDYIKDCLESIKNQTYKDYEVIVVNDGTKDKSMDIVKKYDVKVIEEENSGLSEARNNGAKFSHGEYLIFLDSDDYWEEHLLEELAKAIEDKPDVVRFQIQDVKGEDTHEYNEDKFDTCKGEKAFAKICKYHYVENAWAYCIKRSYYENNKFKFAKGRIHEDFGLIPLVIIKAKRVKSISYVGYNYRQRDNSIMSNKNYEKTKKKVDDFIYHYTYLIKEINKTKLDSKYFKSFISNSLILKLNELNNKDFKEYKKILKEEKVYDNLLTDTLSRKIKKFIIKLNPKLITKISKKV